jgi:hypothetical protein
VGVSKACWCGELSSGGVSPSSGVKTASLSVDAPSHLLFEVGMVALLFSGSAISMWHGGAMLPGLFGQTRRMLQLGESKMSAAVTVCNFTRETKSRVNSLDKEQRCKWRKQATGASTYTGLNKDGLGSKSALSAVIRVISFSCLRFPNIRLDVQYMLLSKC